MLVMKVLNAFSVYYQIANECIFIKLQYYKIWVVKICLGWHSKPKSLALIANPLPFELSWQYPSQQNIHSQPFGHDIWSVIKNSSTE